MGLVSSLIRTPLCFGFPAYMTFKALHSGHPQAQAAWLQYWACAGALLLLEYFGMFVLFWLPGYSLMFTLILAHMAWPQSRGVARVYRLLSPQVKKNEPLVDGKIREIETQANAVYPKVAPYVSAVQKQLERFDPAPGSTAASPSLSGGTSTTSTTTAPTTSTGGVASTLREKTT